MKRQAFIITKPLQFMVAASIVDQLGIANNTDLLIVDAFAEAGRFVSNYHDLRQKGGPWGRIGLFSTVEQAYRYARNERNYERLFIDSDCGLRKAIELAKHKLTSRGTIIFVYEEGIGTYRADIYPAIKRRMFNFFGIGSAFGGSLFTSGIFVYDVDAYRSNVGKYGCAATAIIPPLAEFIESNYATLSRLFCIPDLLSSLPTGPYNLYITDWNLRPDLVDKLARLPGTLLLKPHPNLRFADLRAIGVGGNNILPAGVPAELIIMTLLRKYAVTVYHHGSSVSHYMSATGAEFCRVHDV